MNTTALSFDELYEEMRIRVGTGEKVTHNEHLIVPENTLGTIMSIKDGWLYVHWDEDPTDEPWTVMHESDACKLRRLY